ncbi:hypothetical protein BGZ80_008168, partial [Entomortierella chlamydospora]
FKNDIECLSQNGKHYSKNKVTDSPFARSATAKSKPLFDSKEVEIWLTQAEIHQQLPNETRRKVKEQRNDKRKKEWLELQSTWLGIAPKQKDEVSTPADKHCMDDSKAERSDHNCKAERNEHDAKAKHSGHDSKVERNEHDNRAHHDRNTSQAGDLGHDSLDEHQDGEKDIAGNNGDIGTKRTGMENALTEAERLKGNVDNQKQVEANFSGGVVRSIVGWTPKEGDVFINEDEAKEFVKNWAITQGFEMSVKKHTRT